MKIRNYLNENIEINKKIIWINGINEEVYIFLLISIFSLGGSILLTNKENIDKKIDKIVNLNNMLYLYNYIKNILIISLNKKRINLKNIIYLEPQNVYTLLKSSGSSGTDKYIIHRLTSHIISGYENTFKLNFDKINSYLFNLSLYNVSGFSTIIRALITGGTLVLKKRKDNLTTIKESGITHISMVMLQVIDILNYHLKRSNIYRLNRILLGGAEVSGWVKNTLIKRGFYLLISYGSTETASMISLLALFGKSKNYELLYFSNLFLKKNKILLFGPTLCELIEYSKKVKKKNTEIELNDIACYSSKNHLNILCRIDRIFISGGVNIVLDDIYNKIKGIKYIKNIFIFIINHKIYGERPIAFISLYNKMFDLSKIKLIFLKKNSQIKWPDFFFIYNSKKKEKIKRNSIFSFIYRFLYEKLK